MNTTQKNRPFYYKYFFVNASKHFVQTSFVRIREFSGPSYNCEYGGFILSEYLDIHLKPHGPYCTQHGSEPLVNQVTTFYSTEAFFTLMIFSYTFLIDVDIKFQSTNCEGVIDICSVAFDPHRNVIPVNYKVLFTNKRRFSRNVHLLITHGCVIVQRVSNEEKPVCIVGIYVRSGKMRSLIQIQNNFR